MAGYSDTRQLIIDTLMGRPAGTEIQPEDHQAFALALNDYIRSVELVAGSGVPVAFAEPDTVPVQPNNGQAVYLSQVPCESSKTFSNFIGQYGNALSVSSAKNEVKLVTLLWNGSYWSKQETSIPVITDTTSGYLFMGIAKPTTTPNVVTVPCFYITQKSGTYANFSNIEVLDGETAVLKKTVNGEWEKESISISQNRFIDFTKSKSPRLPLYDLIVYANIENPEEGYGYFVSALLNYSDHLDVYIDKYKKDSPSESKHLPYIGIQKNGQLYSTTHNGTKISLIVDKTKFGDGPNISWGDAIHLEFSDYAFNNQEFNFLEKEALLWESIHSIPDCIISKIEWEQPYSSVDNYACYVTEFAVRNTFFSFEKETAGLPLVASPKKGIQSIKVENNHSIVLNLKTKILSIKRTNQVLAGEMILFSTLLGYGKKFSLSSAEQIQIISMTKNANMSDEQWSNVGPLSNLLGEIGYCIQRVPENTIAISQIGSFSSNVLNLEDPNILRDCYIAEGVITPLSSMWTTGFVPVVQGETYMFETTSSYGQTYASRTSLFDLEKRFYGVTTNELHIEGSSWFVKFVSPINGYIRTSFLNWQTQPMILRGYEVWGDYPTEYIPYSFKLNVEESVATLSSEMQNKISGVLEKPKNLFDPSNIEVGYRFNYYAKPKENPGSCCSGLIPVEEGEIYTLHRTKTGLERTICCYNSSGNVVKPILAPDGTELSAQSTSFGENFTFLIPTGAKFLRFNIDWYPTYVEGDENGWQLEKGDSFTGFEPYFPPYIIVPYESLPGDLEGLSEKVENLENASRNSLIRINVKTSDKVGFFSNSFLEGYAMLGKHAIEKLMAFSDYIGYNYSKSGDDMAEETSRLDRDLAHLGICKPSEIGSLKYGIIMHQDNDEILYGANRRTYYENAKHLGYSIMSLGGQPIISTEHDWASNYLLFQRLCQEEGWKFADWGKVYADISIGQYRPFWYSGHPATRSNWCQVHGFLPIIQSLPRPIQSLKLFRLRSFIDSSDLKNLLYNTNLERMERWHELHNGQSAIIESQNARFDRWATGGYSAGSYNVQVYNDEYQQLIKNNAVNFGNHLLADITVPYNVRSVSYLKFVIKGTGISNLYSRQIRYMTNSWLPSSSSKFIAFGVTSGIENLHVGDSITISGITREDGLDLNKTYTITGISDGYVITNESSGSHITSGTDTVICSVPGVTMHGSYDFPSGAYMENYNKPIGQWVEIDFTSSQDGIEVILTSDQIQKFGVADKFVFMASGSGISITDAYVDISGVNVKERFENSISLPAPKMGTSLLTTTLFRDEDTAWNNISQIEKSVKITDGTYTEVFPENTVRELKTGEWMSQELNTSLMTNEKYKEPRRIQIQILARWFPKYILTDEEYQSSEITPDSFDMSKLEVQLNNSSLPSEGSQSPVTTMYIGAWWNVHVFEMDLVGTPSFLTLKCVDKRVQIAKCDVVLL